MCSSCRQTPVYRRPSFTPGGNGGVVVPTPEKVNQTMRNLKGDTKSRVTGLKYVPK